MTQENSEVKREIGHLRDQVYMLFTDEIELDERDLEIIEGQEVAPSQVAPFEVVPPQISEIEPVEGIHALVDAYGLINSLLKEGCIFHRLDETSPQAQLKNGLYLAWLVFLNKKLGWGVVFKNSDQVNRDSQLIAEDLWRSFKEWKENNSQSGDDFELLNKLFHKNQPSHSPDLRSFWKVFLNDDKKRKGIYNPLIGSFRSCMSEYSHLDLQIKNDDQEEPQRKTDAPVIFSIVDLFNKKALPTVLAHSQSLAIKRLHEAVYETENRSASEYFDALSVYLDCLTLVERILWRRAGCDIRSLPGSLNHGKDVERFIKTLQTNKVPQQAENWGKALLLGLGSERPLSTFNLRSFPSHIGQLKPWVSEVTRQANILLEMKAEYLVEIAKKREEAMDKILETTSAQRLNNKPFNAEMGEYIIYLHDKNGNPQHRVKVKYLGDGRQLRSYQHISEGNNLSNREEEGFAMQMHPSVPLPAHVDFADRSYRTMVGLNKRIL